MTVLRIGLFLVSFFYLGMSSVSSSELVDLPLGSQVEREGIQKIMDAKNVAQFIDSIETEDLKVIGIRRQLATRTRITIPASHLATLGDEPQMFNLFDNATKSNGGLVVGLSVPMGSFRWNPDAHVLLVYKDVPLSVLMHEYLHYLIHTGPTKISTPLHEAPVSRHELSTYTSLKAREFADAKQKMKKMPTVANQVDYIVKHIDYSLADFFARKALNLEELEIDTFLLYRRELLNFSPQATWLTLATWRNYNNRLFNTQIYQKRLTFMSGAIDRLDSNAVINSELLSELKRKRDLLKSEMAKIQKIRLPSTADLIMLARLNKNRPGLDGDTTCNGIIDQEDKVFLALILQDESIKLTYAEFATCDVNNDEKIDASDLALLEEILAKKEK